MTNWLFRALVVVVCLLVGVAHAEEVGTPTVDVLTYELGPGDVLDITVVGEEDMTGESRVAADGTVDLPHAGVVTVSGLTLDAALHRIESHLLSSGYLVRPQVLLTLKKAVSKRVEVTGGVVKPGIVTLERGRTTVSNLLVLAGGLVDPSTARADIWRDGASGRAVIPVDLEAIARGDASKDLEIQPGDYFVVPQPQQIFVDGQVQKPGGYPYRDGMTLTQAITAAGGATGLARMTAVQVRRGADQAVINVKRVMRGVESDYVLRPGDQVYVPESVF